MSNTQDPLMLQQRQVQQRQILAMMGIRQWIQPDSTTLKIADIANPVAPVQPLIDNPVAESTIDDSSVNLIATTQPVMTNVADNKQSFSQADSVSAALIDAAIEDIEITQTVTDSIAPLVTKVTAPVEFDSLDTNDNNKALDKVVSFNLQGGRYGNWVLIVDIQALDSDSEKLWQNITQALSLECETSSFPICVGMNTAELANASLAGYIFKIGHSEDIVVAALTALSDGLTHPNLTTVPTLEAMLADSSLKRQLWEQISQ